MSCERVSVITFNLWNNEYLERRKTALTKFFKSFDADIIMLQEVRPTNLAIVQESLPSHSCVEEQDFKGWTHEGNIFWNRNVFQYVSHELVDVGMYEPWRRLFVVNLRSNQSGKVFRVCNAHFSWEGSAQELQTGFSNRIDSTHKVANYLEGGLAEKSADYFIFGGDLNDRYHPRIVMAERLGFVDSFSQLLLPMRSTWPTPSWRWVEDEKGGVDNPCDWIFTHPTQLRSICAQALDFSLQGTHPSDHFPVMAVYQTCQDQNDENQ
eukprot:TRINITY_DN7104_c0_g1_i4.p1 TRINITY_DN7104_c0_g1~~TRINITY_DN7104_c0_g1_i4.p1  ORF type:complete len:282 (-),score=43.43 TRINITY_DN7104_c0_g1_i4:39-836(-)